MKSGHVVEFGNEYQSLIERHITARQPKVPFYSSVTGKILDESETLGPTYWRTNLESPVLFSSAVTAILLDQPENNLFLEIGPHTALSGSLRQIFKASSTQSIYEPTLVRGKDCVESMLKTAGQLYSHAVSIDFSALNPSGTVLTNLPIYPWHHDRSFCGESRVSREWRFRKYAHHDILGSRVTEGNDLEPTWRNVFGLDNVPWVRDHKILDDIVFPAAAYIAMAGEAVRQITSTDSFSLRHMVIGRALVLHESETIEIVTNMRPLRLTDTLDSAWFEFNISSYSGTTWTKNCSGQVRGDSYNNEREMTETIPLPIEVSTPEWYRAMRKIGLNYGTVFQGMSSITAGPNDRMAAAKVIDQREPQESHYQIHPTAIDSCLQLFTVAMSRGMPRHLTKLSMPTEIEELYIGRCSAKIQVHVDASLSGKAIGIAGDEVVFQLKGLKWSPLKDQPRVEQSPDPHAGAHLVWKENIDFADIQSLIHPVTSRKDLIVLCENMAILCALETLDRVASIKTQIPHLEKYRSWLEMQKRRAELGENDILKGTQDLVKLSREDRVALIDNTAAKMQSREASAASIAMVRILKYATRIFDGSIQAIEVLHEGDALTNLYNLTHSWNCKDFIDLLSHSKPHMKVLEIGAGTGGTTAAALKDLTSMQGDRFYSKYTYTDISSGFFIAARERFKDFPNIEYATLDISMDPISQGFEAESYDLILATNVSLS
jgi:acyl transferase domain-containing protein